MDQSSEPLEWMAMGSLAQEKLERAEIDSRFPKLRCRDEVLRRANLTTEFQEYDASENAGWTRSG